jgi:hypothetical protein
MAASPTARPCSSTAASPPVSNTGIRCPHGGGVHIAVNSGAPPRPTTWPMPPSPRRPRQALPPGSSPDDRQASGSVGDRARTRHQAMTCVSTRVAAIKQTVARGMIAGWRCVQRDGARLLARRPGATGGAIRGSTAGRRGRRARPARRSRRARRASSGATRPRAGQPGRPYRPSTPTAGASSRTARSRPR